jgi:hypothetical protein
MFTTRLLAAAAFAAAMCVPAHADDAYPPNTLPNPPPNALPITPPNPLTADENGVPPKYNQIPQDYDEFAAVYNKAQAFIRDAGIQPTHKCFPAGITPSELIGWCQDYMTWADPKGQSVTVSDTIKDDGKHFVSVCFGDDDTIRRCYRDDGAVYDQTHDRKISLWVTFRHIAGAWNERGKPLSDLKPNAPNPPAEQSPPPVAAPTPPAEQSLPAATSVLPPKYNQIPQDYDEFAAVYNKALTFLRATGAQSIHKCHSVGADPSNPNHGWCTDTMFWGNPQGEHIVAFDDIRDDGRHSVVVCLGDDMNTQRCYQDDGAVFDQSLNRKINLWVTFRHVAGAWNERGKPLSDLKPNTPNPLAEQSPPAATTIVPPKYDHIPNSYDEFVAAYNNALAFLRDHGNAPTHKCLQARSDPRDRRGWCQDVMLWSNDTGQHLTAVEAKRDDGTQVIELCSGDDMNTQRCYRDDGAVFDQSLNRKINLWVTSRTVAWAWNERGKPLSNLTPRRTREIKR